MRDYPKVKLRYQGTFEFASSGSGQHARTERKLSGYMLSDATETQYLQFRLDGFSLNRLTPYTSWEEISAEAHKWWTQYLELTKPKEITRLGLRYINRIMVPKSNGVNILADPIPTPLLRGEVMNYLNRYHIRPAPETDVIYTIAIEEETKEGFPLAVDIDASTSETLGLEADLMAQFEQLREFKNRVFFNVLTEESLKSYE